MKKFFLFIPLLLVAEIDPFSAGLNSGYGLTATEKAILNNKKSINELRNRVKELKKSIDSVNLKFIDYEQIISDLKDKVSALNSIISEISFTREEILKLKREINTTNSKYKELILRINSLEKNVSKINYEIASIKKTIKGMNEIQNQNFNYLKNSILEILENLKKLQTQKLSPKEAFKKAKELFFSGELDKAKELFLFSLSKNYLPATSSYYLGEIYFKKGDYNKALVYYKKSVTLYPQKTSFSAKLLYHTAIAFEKLGNKQAAKLSLKKLILDYSSSKYAKLAKKELEKLQ